MSNPVNRGVDRCGTLSWPNVHNIDTGQTSHENVDIFGAKSSEEQGWSLKSLDIKSKNNDPWAFPRTSKPAKPTNSWGQAKKDSLQESSAFYRTLSELRNLLNNVDPDDDDSDLNISDYAFDTTQYLLIETYRRIGTDFPTPAVFPNGGEGVLLQWNKNDCQVRLVVPKSDIMLMYIYHEDKNAYDAEGDVSPDSLASWLTWLNNHR